jgi:hypothetical protein
VTKSLVVWETETWDEIGRHGGGMADEVVKKLQALTLDDPTLKAIEKMAQAAHPLAETLRAIEHSSIGLFEREMR